MKLSPIKKQMKESANEWQNRKKLIRQREMRKRIAKEEKAGGKRS